MYFLFIEGNLGASMAPMPAFLLEWFEWVLVAHLCGCSLLAKVFWAGSLYDYLVDAL